jgi:DNA mismatch repair protein MutL
MPSPSFGGTGSDSLAARKAYLLQKRAERMALQGTPASQGTSETSSPFQSESFKTNTPPVSSLFGPAAAESPTPSPQNSSFSYREAVDYASEASNSSSPPAPSALSSSLQALAQVAQSYIVAQDAEGIVIIDQHAAHERVMLGRLRNNEAAREPAKQALLAPTHLELDYREKAILEENLDLLNSLGFEIETFGGNTFTVEAVPDFLAGEDIQAIMKGFIDDLLNDQSPMEAHRRHEHILHTIACRAAAKFGKKLSLMEQDALIRSLEGTDDSCACAHGRPTMIRLRFDELEKKFGRK